MAEAGIGFVDILPRTTAFTTKLVTDVKKAMTVAEGATTRFGGLTRGVQLGMVGLGVATVAAIGKGITATTDWASQVRALQRVTGQTAEEASALAGGASELGLSVKQLTTGFGLLSKNIVNNSENLTKYGIATHDAEGNVRPFDEVLAAVSEKFATLPEGPEQAAFAMNVFGRSGKDLIPILQRGSAGLQELKDNAEAAGLVMSQDDVDAAKELSLAQRELSEAFEGASIRIGQAFVPLLTKLVELITGAVEIIQKVPQPVLEMAEAFVVTTAGLIALNKIFTILSAAWKPLLTNLGLVATANEGVAASATTAGVAMEGEAVAASGLSTAMTGLLSRLGGLAKSALAIAVVVQSIRFAVETFHFFSDAISGDFESAIRHSAQAMRIFGINVPDLGPTTEQAEAAKVAFQDLDAQVKAGAISGADAVVKYHELADEVGIHLSEAFDTGILLQAEFVNGQKVATDITQKFADALAEQEEAAIASGEGIGRAGQEFVDFANDLGGDGKQKLVEWHQAVRKAAEDNGAAVREFLRGVTADWQEFQQNAAEGLDFIPDRLQDIEADGKVTAGGILTAFRKARQDTRDFGKDLLTISREGGEAGDALATKFLELGDTIGADAVAGAPPKLRDKIIDMSAKGQEAADDLATKLTNSIADPLESIKDTLIFIAEHVWGIKLPVSVTGDTAELAQLVSNLGKLRSAGGAPPGGGGSGTGGLSIDFSLAKGGVLHGATGFVTHGPVFQVGEAGTELVDPLESPRAARLRAQSIVDALGILGVKPSLGTNDVRVHLTVGIDDTGNLHVRRIAQDEIQRESRYRDRVPA